MVRFGIQGAKVADEMSSVILNNPIDVSLETFADRLFDRMVEHAQHEKDLDSILTSDQDSWRMMASLLLRHNKRRLQDARS
jgi:hypothetical protein